MRIGLFIFLGLGFCYMLYILLSLSPKEAKSKEVQDDYSPISSWTAYSNESNISKSYLFVKWLSDTCLHFFITIEEHPYCTGGIDGLASVSGNSLWQYSSQDCKNLSLDFHGPSISVKESQCYFHGFHCQFEKDYFLIDNSDKHAAFQLWRFQDFLRENSQTKPNQ